MGRKPGYDREDVLRAAVALFRERGFHGVSVRDLVNATGLNRFALYEKFGGKEGLFYATLDFYHEVLIKEELLGPLYRGNASIDSLLSMLQTTRALALDPLTRCGCLIVNANIEFGGADERVVAAADAVIDSFRDATLNVLDLSLRRGDINITTLTTERANYVAVMIQAFFALAYISRRAADKLILRLIHEVQSWQPVRRSAVSSLLGR